MGNLRNTRGNIIKVKSRDRSGRPIHKSEFSTDDKKAVDRELRVWKDKLGVPISTFKNLIENPFDDEEFANVKELMKKDREENRQKVRKAVL